MRNKILLIILLILLFVSCKEKNNTPKRLLETIYQLDLDKDYLSLENYIYEVKFRDPKNGEILFNSKDRIISGIKSSSIGGAFSYSKEGILFHSKKINKMIVDGNDKLINEYLKDIIKSDEFLLENSRKNKKYFKFYINGVTTIVLLKNNNQYKLLYSSFIDIIPKKNKKIKK